LRSKAGRLRSHTRRCNSRLTPWNSSSRQPPRSLPQSARRVLPQPGHIVAASSEDRVAPFDFLGASASLPASSRPRQFSQPRGVTLPSRDRLASVCDSACRNSHG
jgi:hypothetical protein